MGRKNQGTSRQQKTLQVWTYEQARAADPYLGSIVRSLRERRLEAVHAHQAVNRLEKAPGRPDRHGIIALEEARREARQANERFKETLHELLDMDVYSLDPVQGLALVPFVHEDQLAWFVYNVFDRDPIRFWRYHTDALETRRPLSEVTQQHDGSLIV
ncbi:MAG TPA: DUF2203 family protein [Gemmataceae bacterium]|nr:DUF2203 family protein [Gemmataceae bacterium]